MIETENSAGSRSDTSAARAMVAPTMTNAPGNPRSISSQRRLVHVTTAAALGLAALSVVGCLSPERAVRDADDAAYSIIREKQQSALGQADPDPFSIERPEDALRRRLMLEQNLPAAGPASFGRDYLAPVPKQPGGVTGDQPLPEGAAVVTQRDIKTDGLKTPTFAADIAMIDLGKDPGGTTITGQVGPDESLVLGPMAEAPDRPEPIRLSLVDALQVAAKNSRQYQSAKETVFLSALDLDFERDRFEFRFVGTLDASVQSELEGDDTAGVVISPGFGFNKLFKTGALITSRIGVDLSKLLTGEKSESLGIFADASVTVPLLQGAGVEVVTEPLQQSERNAVYAIWDFERFKHEFAVDVAARYFGVLQALDQITNSQGNYERLRFTTSRSRALFEEGRLPGIQVDQAISNELQAYERLISAQQRYEQQLDSFKVFLGLPPDASMELDRNELRDLAPLADRVIGSEARSVLGLYGTGDEAAATRPSQLGPDSMPTTQPTTQATTGPTTLPTTLPEPGDREEIDEALGIEELSAMKNPYDLADQRFSRQGIEVALQNRLDLAISVAQVKDAQRRVVVAADRLESILDFTGGVSLGEGRGALSGGQPDSTSLSFSDGSYSAGLNLDLPFERTSERNAYRESLISLDRAVRDAQEFEDNVKLDIIQALRNIRVSAENLRIQAQAIIVAERRVAAANLLLELGRGEVRDVTEAEDSLITAQNSFTQALVDFYITELELQRDLGVLKVDNNGLYQQIESLFAVDTPVGGSA